MSQHDDDAGPGETARAGEAGGNPARGLIRAVARRLVLRGEPLRSPQRLAATGSAEGGCDHCVTNAAGLTSVHVSAPVPWSAILGPRPIRPSTMQGETQSGTFPAWSIGGPTLAVEMDD